MGEFEAELTELLLMNDGTALTKPQDLDSEGEEVDNFCKAMGFDFSKEGTILTFKYESDHKTIKVAKEGHSEPF